MTANRSSHSDHVQRDVGEVGQDVGRAGAKSVKGGRRRPRRRPSAWAVPAPVEQVVHATSPVTLSRSRATVADREDDAGEDHGGEEDLEGDGVPEGGALPGRHDAQGAVEPAHVPVGLHGVGDLRRVVGAELPDGVDLANAPSSAVAAVTMKRKPVVLAMKVGNIGEPTRVVLGAPFAGELGVLLVHQQAEVRREEADQDERDDQDVDDEEAGMRTPVPGRLSAPQERHQVAADERDRWRWSSRCATRRPISGRRAASTR